MSNLVDEKLMNATGAVIIENETIGTAWLFSDGYLLTAAHVLCRDVDHDTGKHDGLYDHVQIQFGSFALRPAQRYHLDFRPEKGIDFAILKMDVNELPRNCLPLPIACVEWLDAKSEIKAYGYGETLGYPTTGNGTYSGLANVPKYRLFRLRSGELADSGFSGAAIYSLSLEQVVALEMKATTATYLPVRDTVIAMPLYRVGQLWPKDLPMPVELEMAWQEYSGQKAETLAEVQRRKEDKSLAEAQRRREEQKRLDETQRHKEKERQAGSERKRSWIQKSENLIVWKKDSKEMVRVPAGEFVYGSRADDKTADNDEKPQGTLWLPEFWVDKTPVTVAEYRQFLEARGHEPPSSFRVKKSKWFGLSEEWEKIDWAKFIQDTTLYEEYQHHPIIYVTWFDAKAYADWSGKRLPTEMEREKAARGTDGRRYPWGKEKPTAERCNFDNNIGGTTPVGQYSPAGDSPYGCVDMSGNVREWCSSEFKDYPYQADDGREDLNRTDVFRVLRGGAFLANTDNLRAAYRSSGDPDVNFYNDGFRVISSPF